MQAALRNVIRPAALVLGLLLILATVVVALPGVASPARADTPGLIWPASGTVTQKAAEHLANEGARAIDIANAAADTPVVAAAAGAVITASVGGNTTCFVRGNPSNGLGNYVVIEHSDATGTTYTTYAHFSSILVAVGQDVTQGQRLGTMGRTGCATGQHVHFSVSTGPNEFISSEWNSPDPSDGTRITQGTAIAGSNYPGTSGTVTPAIHPADGSFVRVTDNREVYEIVGGAPVYVSNWAAVGGQRPALSVSRVQLDKLPFWPRNGTFIRGDSRQVYVMAGGAPIYVSTWSAFGGQQRTTLVDQDSINRAGQAGRSAHLRRFPRDGTLIRGNQTRRVYQTVDGSPQYLTSWAAFGGPQPSVAVDQAAINHASQGGVWWHLLARPTSPLLGEPWGLYQVGFGTAIPSLVFNGGDPTGLFENLTWSSWGGATADGRGTALYEDGSVIVAAEPREPASFRAYDLGTCQGHRVYLHLAVWFPQHGETFNPATNGETFYTLCPN